MALGDGIGWNENAPITTEPRADGADEIRDLRKGIAIRMNKEHEKLDADAPPGEGGEHLEGSAKAYYEATAPTNRPGPVVTALVSTADDGRLWIDEDDDTFYHWAGDAWVETGTRSKEGKFSGSDITDFNAGTGVTVDPGYLTRWFHIVFEATNGVMLHTMSPLGLEATEKSYRVPRHVSNVEACKIKRVVNVITITKSTFNILNAYWVAMRYAP